MELKRLRPTGERNEFFIGDSEERIRGVLVGDYPVEYSRANVLQANFLKDQLDEMIINRSVPFGEVIGYFYENYNGGGEAEWPDHLLVRFVRKPLRRTSGYITARDLQRSKAV